MRNIYNRYINRHGNEINHYPNGPQQREEKSDGRFNNKIGEPVFEIDASSGNYGDQYEIVAAVVAEAAMQAAAALKNVTVEEIARRSSRAKRLHSHLPQIIIILTK